MALTRRFEAVIVGGGPGGLAPLLAAHKNGKLDELLHRGVLLVEQGASIGQGRLGSYAISSDSTGYTFVDPLRVGNETALHRVLELPVGQRIAAAGPEAVSLTDAGELQDHIGKAFIEIFARYPQSAILLHTRAEGVRRLPDGGWQVTFSQQGHAPETVEAHSVIMATGASQPAERLAAEKVAGVPVLERWGDRLIQSGDVVAHGGFAAISERLRRQANPSVAILGGSTSAMAIANALLVNLKDVNFGEGGITIFHRRPLRIYYLSVEEALADNYTEFGPDDICPITQRVFRLAGMRLDSRELLMRVRGIGGRTPEPRVKLHLLQEDDPEGVRRIDDAHLVIAALGYRPNGLPVVDKSGAPITLLAATGPQRALVDGQCRVLDAEGRPIAGLFGIGLASGFLPYGELGGEPSFRGQANGLWLWQNNVGAMIVDAILSSQPAVHRPETTGDALDRTVLASRHAENPISVVETRH